MSFIYIKRKREPVELSEERAQRIKKIWIANPKSTDLLDLGDWSGEISQIVSIEIESKKKISNTQKELAEENIQARKEILATPIEKRAKMLEKFKLFWFTRSGLTEKEAPEDILAKAEKISLAWYTKNPNTISVPVSEFEPILFARWGVKKNQDVREIISSKMTVIEPHPISTDVPF